MAKLNKCIFVGSDGKEKCALIDFSKFKSVKSYFGKSGVLYVVGDIVLKGKGNLPDFSGVKMVSESPRLDCGKCKVYPGATFPMGVHYIDCSQTVYSVSLLYRCRIPSGAKSINVMPVVAKKVMSGDPTESALLSYFSENCPVFIESGNHAFSVRRGIDLPGYEKSKEDQISVIDALERARDAYQQYEQGCAAARQERKRIQLEKQEKEQVLQRKMAERHAEMRQQNALFIPEKTNDYLSRSEVLEYFFNLYPERVSTGYDKVKRAIRFVCALSNRNKIDVKLVSSDNTLCVHRSCLDVVVSEILSFVDEKNQVCESDKTSEAPSVSNDVPVKPTEGKVYHGSQEIVEQKMDVYILPGVFTKMVSICGDNRALLLRMLENVVSINVKPTTNKGRRIFSLQDGHIVTVSGLKLKSAQCFAQNFENNNRSRVVWWTNDNVVIGVGCFNEHEKKFRILYNSSVSSVDLSKIDLDRCMSVPDLVRKLRSEIQYA